MSVEEGQQYRPVRHKHGMPQASDGSFLQPTRQTIPRPRWECMIFVFTDNFKNFSTKSMTEKEKPLEISSYPEAQRQQQEIACVFKERWAKAMLWVCFLLWVWYSLRAFARGLCGKSNRDCHLPSVGLVEEVLLAFGRTIPHFCIPVGRDSSLSRTKQFSLFFMWDGGKEMEFSLGSLLHVTDGNLEGAELWTLFPTYHSSKSYPFPTSSLKVKYLLSQVLCIRNAGAVVLVFTLRVSGVVAVLSVGL